MTQHGGPELLAANPSVALTIDDTFVTRFPSALGL